MADRSGDHMAQSSASSAKIGVVGPYPPYRGGVAQFTDRFHRALEDAGQAVVGMSFHRQYPSLLFPGTSQEVEPSSGATQRSIPRIIDSIGPLSWRRAADRLIDEGITRAVFMHWMPFFAPAYASIAARLTRNGIPCSAVVHNAIPHEGQPFARPLTRRFMRHCDHIVALSDTVRRDLTSMGIGSQNDASMGAGGIDVRPHPTYDQFGDAVDKRQAREALDIPSDATVLLFFGLVRRYKGVDILLDALSRTTSDPYLVVAGEWYEDRKEAEAVIERAGMTDRVRLVDQYIADDDVANYFSAADVVVQPYRSATQSGVVQTAFHFARPVIVTGVGGLPEMVRHETDALVVAPEDPAALATAIDRLQDSDLLARLSHGAEEARNRFTWEHFTQPFLVGPSS